MDDFMDKFLIFEENCGLLNEEIDGFRFWPYMRFKLYNKYAYHFPQKEDKGIHLKKNIECGMEVLSNLMFHTPEISRKDILFLCHERRMIIDGLYEDIYTDRLADIYPYVSISCEFPYNRQHLKPHHTRHLLYLDNISLMAFWKTRTAKIGVETQNKIEKKAFQISNEMNKRLGLNTDIIYIKDLMRKLYVRYFIIKKMFTRILQDIKPKVMIGVVSYVCDKMILYETANAMGIKTIELQHGVIGKGHVGYNYLVDREYPWLPQMMFYWAPYWIGSCKFPIGSDNKYAVGFPYHDFQINKYKKSPSKYGEIRIVMLSQPEVDIELMNLAGNILKTADENGIKVEMIFKLHPHSYGKKFDQMDELVKWDSFQLIDTSKEPLYSIFARSDVQIGVSSTALFEGLSYNLLTFVYDIWKSRIYMNDLLNSGYAKLFSTAEEFVSAISNGRCAYLPDDVSKDFFVPDGIDNMRRIIDVLINKD